MLALVDASRHANRRMLDFRRRRMAHACKILSMAHNHIYVQFAYKAALGESTANTHCKRKSLARRLNATNA